MTRVVDWTEPNLRLTLFVLKRRRALLHLCLCTGLIDAKRVDVKTPFTTFTSVSDHHKLAQTLEMIARRDRINAAALGLTQTEMITVHERMRPVATINPQVVISRDAVATPTSDGRSDPAA